MGYKLFFAVFLIYYCDSVSLKPHRKKKPFIEKKKAVSFHLVHRSQRDPLAADETAPQRVLLPTQCLKATALENTVSGDE